MLPSLAPSMEDVFSTTLIQVLEMVTINLNTIAINGDLSIILMQINNNTIDIILLNSEIDINIINEEKCVWLGLFTSKYINYIYPIKP